MFDFSGGPQPETGTNAPKKLHVTVQKEYPQVARLPLPPNIDANETTRFSPQRTRDISGTEICLHQSLSLNQAFAIDVTCDSSADPHLGSYDCMGSVNLYSAMQSNVPEPFGGSNKFSHLNMPGGQWSQTSKFMAEDLQSAHYTNLRQAVRVDWNNKQGTFAGSLTHFAEITPAPPNSFVPKRHFSVCVAASSSSTTNKERFGCLRAFSTQNQPESKHAKEDPTKLAKEEATISTKDKLKRAVKEYGSTVIVFHVSISLASLGLSYALVSR